MAITVVSHPQLTSPKQIEGVENTLGSHLAKSKRGSVVLGVSTLSRPWSTHVIKIVTSSEKQEMKKMYIYMASYLRKVIPLDTHELSHSQSHSGPFKIEELIDALTSMIDGNMCSIHLRIAGVVHFNVNTLRPRQNGRHLPDNIFKCIFLNENVRIPIKIRRSLFLRVQLTIFQHWFR